MRVGSYEVLGELARGSMGVVYRARARDGAPVALKVLNAQSPVASRRLAREARALVRLNHPHVVRLLEAGEAPAGPWLALQFVEGETLEARLRRGPLSVGEARRLVAQLADALDHAHAQGVLHRDLKPDNVLLRGEDALLTDFGLTREADGGSQLTSTGVFLGTPGYWPPEQLEGSAAAVGPWSDVYGLGALLHACLTGRAPIVADSLQAYLQPARFQEVEGPRRVRAEVPEWLDALCLRCLAVSPRERPASAADVRDALLRGAPPAAPPQATRALPPLLLGLAVALGTVAVGGLLSREATPPRASAPPPEASPSPPASSAQSSERLARHREAVDHAAHDRFAESVRAYDRLIELDPEFAEAWAGRGAAKAGQGHYAEALSDLERALVLEPEHRGALANRAAVLQNMGRYEAALEATDQALLLEPESPRLQLNRCFALLDLGHYAEAHDQAERLLAQDPGSARGHYVRGSANLHMGRYPEAIDDYSRSLELQPSFANAWANRGAAKAFMGRNAEALSDLDQALSLNPAHVNAWANRGAANLNLNRYPEAVADCSRALELAPSQPGPWLNRGAARSGLGQHADALSDLDQALSLNPDLATAWTYRGLSLAALGRREEAISDLERALHLGVRPPLSERTEAALRELGAR